MEPPFIEVYPDLSGESSCALCPELYHYTKLDNLNCILGSKQLWATHFPHLNDKSEIFHIKPNLVKKLAPMIEEWRHKQSSDGGIHFETLSSNDDPSGDARRDAEIAIEKLFDGTFHNNNTFGAPFANPYITSFCSHNDDDAYTKKNGLLSMWRAYGGGTSCCIVFDTKMLLEMLKEEAVTFVYSGMYILRVLYNMERPDLEEYLTYVARTIFKCYEWANENDNGNPQFAGNMYYTLTKAAASLKHRAFHEEREVRIVCFPMGAAQCEKYMQQIRDENRQPKMPFEHPEKTNRIALFQGAHNLPIKRIILGPGLNERSIEDVSDCLKGSELEVPVHLSETPLLNYSSAK